MVDDTRLVWIRERLLALLNEKDTVLFYDLLERDDGRGRKILREFLDRDLTKGSGPQQRLVYFYKTFYDKIVEEEVVVSEPVTHAEKSRDDTPPVVVIRKKQKGKKGGVKKKKSTEREDEGDGEEGEDAPEEAEEGGVDEELTENVMENEGKPTKSGKKKKPPEKPRKDKGKTSPRTAVETPPPPSDAEAPEFALVSRIVQKVVEAPELHILDGPPSGEGIFHVYFLRQSLQPIPIYDSYSEAQSALPRFFTVGGFKGRVLTNFGSVLRSVITPMMENQFREPKTVMTRFQQSLEFVSRQDSVEENDVTVFAQFAAPSLYRRVSIAKSCKNVESVKPVSSAKVEILQDLHSLENRVEGILSYLNEPITLEMPEVDVSEIPKESVDETLPVLVESVKNWEKHIANILLESKTTKPPAEDPLSEISFWQEQSANFQSLLEQFEKPAARKILKFVSEISQEHTQSFLLKKQDLEKLSIQAQENAEILTNISRHLKIVQLSNSFKAVETALADLIDGFRIIWILSHHYNTDEAMVNLMRKISSVLCKKVANNLKSEIMFKNPLPQIVAETRDACDMLTSWKKLYLKMRLEIENSGSIPRWEFDQHKLFADTEYIASVCKDLNDIALVVQQFLAVFGPDFKSVVRDPTQVDTIIKRVENLVLGIEMTDFDIYKPSCRDNWQAVVETFYKDVKRLEKQLKFFIDQAFTMLRNSEDALKMLLKFKQTDTRPLLKEQLLTKFNVLLQELIREIGITENQFNRDKKAPPVLRYQPPESGAIYWERQLFLKMKKPILLFQTIEECDNSPYKKEAFSEYVIIAKQMKDFENCKYEEWCKNTVPICETALDRPILRLEELPNGKQTPVPLQRQKSADSGTLPTRTVITKRVSTPKIPKTRIQETVLSELNLRLVVNFTDGIFHVIEEAELMEYLGFNIPSVVRKIALQRDRLHMDLESVEKMLEEYDKIVKRLSIEELQFTREFVLRVQKHILPGYTRLSWNSLTIQDYVRISLNALKQLSSVLAHAQRIDHKLNEKIALLKTFNLFPHGDPEDKAVMNCLEFFEDINNKRTKAFSEMLDICREIGPILMKLESLVHHTSTGCSPHMLLLYHFWDTKIYEALIEIVLRNLSDFNSALEGAEQLFQVSVVLVGPNVALNPSPEGLHNAIVKSAVDCVERLRRFPRWKMATCLIVKESAPRSFYDRVQEETGPVLKKIQKTAINLAAECHKKLSSWRKYSKLWEQDFVAKCDAFAATNPNLSDYDDKLTFYTLIEQSVEETYSYDKVKSVRMNLLPMVAAIKQYCVTWKKTLADRLSEATTGSMNEFQDFIADLFQKLEKPIAVLEDYRQVSDTIRLIQKSTVSSEIKYEDFQEVYHIFKLHRIKVNPAEEQMSQDVKKQWQELYVSSLYKMHKLQPTKEEFAAKTVKEIGEFSCFLRKFADIYTESGPGCIESDLNQGLIIMKKYRNEFIINEAKRLDLVSAESLFGLPTTDYSSYLSVKHHFEALESVFDVYESLLEFQYEASQYLWVDVNPAKMADAVERFLKIFRGLKETLKRSPVGLAVEKSLKEFKLVVSLMIQLKSDSLVERHWQLLMDKTGSKFNLSSDKFQLSDLFKMELFKLPGVVEEIIASAEQEMLIELKISDIRAKWNEIKFSVAKHSLKTKPRGYILSNSEEILRIIENNAIALHQISKSPFVGPFLKLVGQVEASLVLFSDIIEEWMEVQARWLNLETIMVGDAEVLTQLPKEFAIFEEIDRQFLEVMEETSKNSLVKACCQVPDRISKLRAVNLSLVKCQDSLKDLLQAKRNEFPRFFFLSDEELISVLGSGTEETITHHLLKIFNNITSLHVEDISGSKAVTGLVSFEGEEMCFENAVPIEGKIEVWMGKTVKEMRTTNRFLTKKATFEYGTVRQPRTEWLGKFCGMIGIVASQIWWTAEVENVFAEFSKGEKNALNGYFKQFNAQNDELIGQIRGNLTKNERKKLTACLILAIQNRDTVRNFIQIGVEKQDSFEWQSQLRYYWRKEIDNVVIKQCFSDFDYGYEYFGLSDRLVVTPLTQKMYLTMTQAISMKFGCSLVGPTGAGKTEIIKDLAKAMAVFLVSTNFDGNLDSKSIGNILNGLCRAGAWGCFENFDQISLPTLSVVTSHFLSIKNALKQNMTSCSFGGQEVVIDKKLAIFTTVRSGPIQTRSELSEPIKTLFRPVFCCQPDVEIIIFVTLVVEGFQQAKPLSKNLTVLFDMLENLLSKQPQYDFGLRAIKALLGKTAQFRREVEVIDEAVLVVKVLKDLHFPKLVPDDVPLFLGILKDVFPGVECDQIINHSLSTLVDQARTELGLELMPYQTEKVLQVEDSLGSRHSVILVGPSGGGKSTIMALLQKTRNISSKPSNLVSINPKACSVDELYGNLDFETRNWLDGLIPALFRRAKKKSEDWLIVFDGDMDPIWVENLHSVMDDAKLLTLANGERINLGGNTEIVFELGDLLHASPKTVSRCAVVYVDSSKMEPFAYWKRWLKTQDKDNFEILNFSYGKYVEGLSTFVQHGCLQAVERNELNMLIQLCQILDATIPKKSAYGHYEEEEITDTADEKDLIEAVFIQALYHSFGATVSLEDRGKFDGFIKTTSGMALLDESKKVGVQFLPGDGNIFDYFVDVEKKAWVCWKEVTPKYFHDRNVNFGNILVPTLDTMRANWLINAFQSVGRPLVLVGESGSSKTAILNNYLLNLPKETNKILRTSFSASTTSKSFRKVLESSVNRRTKSLYGPPIGTKLVAFIDDLNMPKMDEFGTQQPLAFLKFLLEYGGFYNLKNQNFTTLADTYIISAMGLPGGGRSKIDPRALSKFAVFNLTPPSRETCAYIFKSVLSNHVQDFPENLQNAVENVIQSALKFLEELNDDLPAVPAKFHYVFHIRDFSRMICGLCQINKEIFKTPESLLRVWRNETMRVFADKLITPEDLALVRSKIGEMVKNLSPEHSVPILRDPLLFGDFRNACREGESRHYEDLLDYDAAYFLFKEILEECTKDEKVVLFEHFIEHLTRIHRILRLNRGHMMLVGENGTGKNTMIRLASFAAGCHVVATTPSQPFDTRQFYMDLKTAFKTAGMKNIRAVFIFDQFDVKDEGILEDMNNVLSFGVVSSIFTQEEKLEIIKSLGENIKASDEEIWEKFCKNTDKNLHIVLAISPIGENFRNCCRNYPGFFKYTTVNWFQPWPPEALISVANTYLAENPEVPEELREGVVKHMVHVHTSLTKYTEKFLQTMRRKVHVTPKQYLDYIELYLDSLKKKQGFIAFQKLRLQTGLRKIAESNQHLKNLHEKLEAQKQIVAKKTATSEDLLKILNVLTNEADFKKTTATKKKRDVEDQERQIKKENEEIEELLERTVPVLKDAKNAVCELTTDDIAELSAFTTPPQAIQTVCECVLYLLGVKEVSWNAAKESMADPAFTEKLALLNCDEISLTQQRLCRTHAKNLPPDLKAACKAAQGLIVYVQAVLGYCAVFREVIPKRQLVERLEEDNLQSLILIEKWKVEIAELEGQMNGLNLRHGEALKDQMACQEETDVMADKLSTADKLMEGLSNEETCWADDFEKLSLETHLSIGDCLLTSAFLSYLGPFNLEFRSEMLYGDWLVDLRENSIPTSDGFQVEKGLCEDVEIKKWLADGCSEDVFSVQNAVLVLKGHKIPFLIDPLSTVVDWLEKRGGNLWKTACFSEPDFLVKLGNAVENGEEILLKNFENFMETSIDNIAGANYRPASEGKVDSNFRLYLSTKISNPSITPSISAKTMVINCMPAPIALENQFLKITLQILRPELENSHKELVEKAFLNAEALKSFEENLLTALSSSTNKVLDNDKLVAELGETKTESAKFSELIKKGAEDKQEVQKMRDAFRKIAHRATILYFVLLDMAVVSPMYTYCLSEFTQVLSGTLASKTEFLEEDINDVLETLTANVFEYACTGIFEKHKSLLAFQIAEKLQEDEGIISQSQVSFLVRENDSTQTATTLVEWLDTETNFRIEALRTEFAEAFGNLEKDFCDFPEEWKSWHDSEMPEISLPTEFSGKLTDFQQLMLLRCLRPDRLMKAIGVYVSKTLGGKFQNPPEINILEILKSTPPSKPIILIVDPSMDSSNILISLAKIADVKIINLQLGRGLEATALKILNNSTGSGQWFHIQNCHLGLNFIRDLLVKLDSISNLHGNFRLILSTELVDYFPLSILERSVKICVEPPHTFAKTLKEALIKTNSTSSNSSHVQFKPLTFMLSFFHSVVVERQKYGSLGWTGPYCFSGTDFSVALEILANFLNKSSDGEISWPNLRYLIGDIVYGGRVTDEYDMKILDTYLEEYFGSFVSDRFQHFSLFYGLKIPNEGEIPAFLETLPQTDVTKILGLHTFSEIPFFESSAKDFCANIAKMQPLCSTNKCQKSQDANLDEICTDILSKIPDQFDLRKIRLNFEMGLKPIMLVLIQELAIFNHQISTMKNSLELLKETLKGKAEMNETLGELAKSLLNGKIPQTWRNLTPPTKKSLSKWMEHFQRRTLQYSEWAQRGEPIVIWLSGLHHPKAYLKSIIQASCRENGWSLHKCVLSTTVSNFQNSDQVEQGLANGTYVAGLYLECAGWDGENTCLGTLKCRNLRERLPVLKVVPVERHRIKRVNGLKTPVYVTSDRRLSGLTFEADLTVNEHVSHWILRAVCLLLNSVGK